MHRVEALAILALAIAMVTTGLVWLFGAWALVGCGAVIGLAAFAIEIRE